MKCKYPDKPCSNHYFSHGVKQGVYCRLAEWKQKQGTCPYNPEIKAHMKIKKKDLDLGQTILVK